MPKSRRSAKRRAKLKKRDAKTYAWALRKIAQMNADGSMDDYLSSLKPTGRKVNTAIEESDQDDL